MMSPGEYAIVAVAWVTGDSPTSEDSAEAACMLLRQFRAIDAALLSPDAAALVREMRGEEPVE